MRAEEQRKQDEGQKANDKKAEDQERAAIMEDTAAELRSSSQAALKYQQRHNEREQRQHAKTGSSAGKPYALVSVSVVVTSPEKRCVEGARQLARWGADLLGRRVQRDVGLVSAAQRRCIRRGGGGGGGAFQVHVACCWCGGGGWDDVRAARQGRLGCVVRAIPSAHARR